MEDPGPRDGKTNLVSTWSKPGEGRWGEVFLMISKVKRYQEREGEEAEKERHAEAEKGPLHPYTGDKAPGKVTPKNA